MIILEDWTNGSQRDKKVAPEERCTFLNTKSKNDLIKYAKKQWGLVFKPRQRKVDIIDYILKVTRP